MNRDQLLEHLKFAAETGVTGVSRDAEWRVRQVASVAPEPAESTLETLAGAVPLVLTPTAAGVTPASAPAAALLASIQTEIGPACTRCKLHAL